MTLIELLAAVAILSAVAAAGVRLVAESGAATRTFKLRIDAVAILDRWRALSSEPFDSGEWQWIDELGRTWIVRVTELPSTTAAPPQGSILHVRSRDVEVILETDGGQLDVLSLNCIVPVDSESTFLASRLGAP